MAEAFTYTESNVAWYGGGEIKKMKNLSELKLRTNLYPEKEIFNVNTFDVYTSSYVRDL